VGYTGVVWESRSAEQLARDLTDGPGPSSVGNAGAAWVRIANAYTAASAEYAQLLDRVRTSWESEHAPGVLARLEVLGGWLHAKALNAAANGQRAEQAAVAATVAIMAMPSVSEAVEAQAQRDIMASLAAYNGAVLGGSFAEFDAAATADQANAAAVMQQYEQAVAPLATAWEEPPPPQVAKGDARAAERAAADAPSGGGAGGAIGAHAGGGAAMPPMPLSARTARDVAGSERATAGRVTAVTAASASGFGGAPYAPMAGMARGHDGGREFESSRPPELLEGGGEAGAGISASAPSWLPAAQLNDGPILVESVSWGPDTAVFDGLADPQSGSDPADDSGPLEQLSDRWVAPAVIGGSTEEP
jgi:hypothetical protein